MLDVDGNLIGSAIATGTVTTVVTSGSSVLADGTHLFTAFQTAPGELTSADSPALAVQIITTPPVATIVSVTPDPITSSPSSLVITFNKPVSGLDLSDLSLSLNSGPDLLTAAQSVSSNDGITWTLTNLSALIAATGTYQLTLDPMGTPIIDVAGNEDTIGVSTTFTLDNSPPTVGISGPTFALRGELDVLTFSVVDPSPIEQAAGFTFTINWGDGSPIQTVTGASGTQVAHAFYMSGSLDVRVTATDLAGLTSSVADFGIQIAALQLVPEVHNPALDDLVWGALMAATGCSSHRSMR